MLSSMDILYSLLMRTKSCITCFAVIGSREATGSSARIILGFWFSVRASCYALLLSAGQLVAAGIGLIQNAYLVQTL